MNIEQPHRIEYIHARRVLLDVLTALEPHNDAVILVGAQAVYLRTAGLLPAYQPYTTDADLVIDPNKLASQPPLEKVMTEAGFERTEQPGSWRKSIESHDTESDPVPVDLIVPAELAPAAGRRSARLPGDHGKDAARKTVGVEGALIDHDHLLVSALEKGDARLVNVKVAGIGALAVAKAHKLGERLNKPERLLPKDAGDVYRLFNAAPVISMADTFRRLLTDPISTKTTEKALEYLRRLFAVPNSPGTELAVQALHDAADAAAVTTFITKYTQELLDRSYRTTAFVDVIPGE